MPIVQMEKERETQRREVAAGWSHAVSGDAEQHLVLFRPSLDSGQWFLSCPGLLGAVKSSLELEQK